LTGKFLIVESRPGIENKKGSGACRGLFFIMITAAIYLATFAGEHGGSRSMPTAGCQKKLFRCKSFKRNGLWETNAVKAPPKL